MIKVKFMLNFFMQFNFSVNYIICSVGDDVNSKYEITIKIKSDNTYEILSSNSNAITNSNGKIEIINNTFGGSNNKAIRLGDKSFIVDSNNTITFSAGSGSSLFFLLFFIIRQALYHYY